MYPSTTSGTANLAYQTGQATVQAIKPFGDPDLDACLSGGLQTNALHEVRSVLVRDFASAAGFALGLVTQFVRSRSSKVFWVLDPASSLDTGTPFPDGLSQHGIDPKAITFVRPITLQDALWATDQAAKCSDITAVIFQVRGNPKRFDMTATRRLMLRARESGVMVCVLRHSGEEEASAAATRWQVEVMPSIPDPGFANGLGVVRHKLTLERNRTGSNGQWTLTWNPKIRAFENGTPLNDTPQQTATHSVTGLHAPADRPDSQTEVGQVLGFERTS